MEISKNIKYIGVNDHSIDLFESQFKVPNGMAYNSYLVIDEKIAVMDTVEKGFTEEWLNNLETALDGRVPDYLIVHHMEPDHAGSIGAFAEKYKDAVIVGSQMAFVMMKNFFGTDFSERRLVVSSGDVLNLGSRDEVFIATPMVHWPEVIMNYDTKDKALFSADAFGKFGANDVSEPWDDEARRYFVGIVGKYGSQVQATLDAIKDHSIEIICPLHGPVLKDDLAHYVALYDRWSSYEPECDGIAICYTSVYGHTREAVKLLADELHAAGKKVCVFDLARDDMFEALGEAFCAEKVVFATTTYNMEIFPFMHTFINHLVERAFQKKKIALIENGSWAPRAAAVMRELLAPCSELDFLDDITIRSAISDANKEQLIALAKVL